MKRGARNPKPPDGAQPKTTQTVQKSVKVFLRSHLCGGDGRNRDGDQVKSIHTALDLRVRAISQETKMRSMLLQHTLLDLYKDGKPVSLGSKNDIHTLLNHSASIDSTNKKGAECSTLEREMRRVYEASKPQYQKIMNRVEFKEKADGGEREVGVSKVYQDSMATQLRTSMSLSYITNLDNHLWVSMDRRFKAFVKSYWSTERPVELSEDDKEVIKSIRWMPGVVHSIWKSFLSGVREPKTPEVVWPWIMAEREAFQVPVTQVLSADYLLDHRDQTLGYMYRMLSYWEAVRLRGGRARAFPLVPIHQTRRMFIRLDTDAMLYLLKDVGMVRGDVQSLRRGHAMTSEEKQEKKRIKEENEKRKEDGLKLIRSKRKKGADKDASDEIIRAHWESVFDFKRYETGPWKFANTAMTDGVALVLLFEKTVPKETKDNLTEEKSTAVQKAKLQMRSHSEVDRWISVDPGRANLVSAAEVEWNPETPAEPKKVLKRWVLTRKAYYSQAGIHVENHRKATWNEAWTDEKNRLQNQIYKTADPAVFKAYLDTYSECHKKIWETKAHTRYARSDMDVYGGKLRALDQFWGQLNRTTRGEGTKVGVLYGACGRTMNATGRGELSVPVRQVLYRCQRMFPTVLVPETNTTKCCAQCGCHLRKLYGSKSAPKGDMLPFRIKEKGVTKVEIRGLRLCMNRGCSLWSDRNSPYVDRDLNAAINIFVAACAKTEVAYLKQGERAVV